MSVFYKKIIDLYENGLKNQPFTPITSKSKIDKCSQLLLIELSLLPVLIPYHSSVKLVQRIETMHCCLIHMIMRSV